MTDHALRAVEALEEVSDLRHDLLREYGDTGIPGPRRPAAIAQLHQGVGAAFKRAEVHALLAIAQRLDDLGLHR